MIHYERDPKQTIPNTAVRVIGLGGAGANMLDRVALDGMEGAELLALNTDVRTLAASVAGAKTQLGLNLTKGLGTGGDPELGRQATLEAEESLRDALRGFKIVFLCVGLGGGTGSGGAPLVARMAREEGAFVVVFATMPFSFEGRRRRAQAEESLNQLVVLANALVTFDNGRMGELVLAKQGVHEAFAAGDRMISESIKAVTRLVVRPGLINIGLDDLMSALRTTRSRCLFGSGVAVGKERAERALQNALSSPLLDQGALLRDAETVLVHLCGGEDLTLYEIETMMERLSKHVPESAHVLFGAAVDPVMGDSVSVTLISALPEERLQRSAADEEPAAQTAAPPRGLEPSEGFGKSPAAVMTAAAEPAEPEPEPELEAVFKAEPGEPEPEPLRDDEFPPVPDDEFPPAHADFDDETSTDEHPPIAFPDEPPADDDDDDVVRLEHDRPPSDDALPFAETGPAPQDEPAPQVTPRRVLVHDIGELPDDDLPPEPIEDDRAPFERVPGRRGSSTQSEMSFEGGRTGKFAGTNPNVFEGEDLDVPSFLRRKKS